MATCMTCNHIVSTLKSDHMYDMPNKASRIYVMPVAYIQHMPLRSFESISSHVPGFKYPS